MLHLRLYEGNETKMERFERPHSSKWNVFLMNLNLYMVPP